MQNTVYKNPEQNKEYKVNYYQKHRAEILLKRKKFRDANPELISERKQKERKRIKLKILSYYSNSTLRCACCGEKQLEFLTIDHIHGGGTQQRKMYGTGSRLYDRLKAQNFPDGYRVLCFNCNSGRSINGGICPHKNKFENASNISFYS